VARVLVVVLALLGAVARGLAAPPTVTWKDGAITAVFDGVPLDEAVAALARAAGVEMRGELLEQREVHATFERVRFPEVLDRLVGEQNFTIVYDAAGQPRRVELLGMPQDPPAPRSSPDGFANLVRGYGTVTLPPVLAGALGRQRADLPWVLRRGARHRDPAIAAAAIDLFVHTVEAEPALHTALLRTDDDRLTYVLRIWFGPATGQCLGVLADETHDPLLRSKARRLEQQLRVAEPGGDAPAT
jgi:hypothetical protein